MKAILFCWIGNTDLAAMYKLGHSEEQRNAARDALIRDSKSISISLEANSDRSSILLALAESSTRSSSIPMFTKVVLLTNRTHKANGDEAETFCNHYRAFLEDRFCSYKGRIEVKHVKTNAYEFQSVFAQTKEILSEYRDSGFSPDDFWYNITPGTIAQQTTWILHGKALSTKSHFIQGSKSKKSIQPCEIPFDISTALSTRAGYLECTTPHQQGDIIGKAPSFVRVINQARAIAKLPVTVLLTGESGTGKEVIANEIHRQSGRTGDLVCINCATLSKELGLSELVGYMKGAFTNAYETTEGKLDAANNGTLFLDEIGECPLDFQAELLRILQPKAPSNPTLRHFTPKGPKAKEKSADVRIICATNKDLTNQNTFREDLYYRISTFQLKLPSLETRKKESNAELGIDDIRDLAQCFLDDFCKKILGRQKSFASSAYDALHNHTWRGNVRELQNVIARAVVFSSSDVITAQDIIDGFGESNRHAESTNTVSDMAISDITTGAHTYNDRLRDFTHQYFTAALQAAGGNKKRAYTTLKVNSRTFNEYL